MRILSFTRVLLVAALVTLPGCTATEPVGPNQYTGCYDNSCVDVPTRVEGVPPFVAISSLASHVCALTADGEAWCWGDNQSGQLGDGTLERRDGPVRVIGDVRFSTISVGSLFTCGLSIEGTLYCWGFGGNGQLGQPATGSCGSFVGCLKAPSPLEGTWTAVSTGMRHACAIDTAGAAWCWGFNLLGETGTTNYFENVSAPVKVSGSNTFVAVDAGDAYTCARDSTDRVLCWGSANRGELGRQAGLCSSVFGFQQTCSPVPVAASTTARFSFLASGFSHSCALTSTGEAWCWGDNGQGQLGTGDFEMDFPPVRAQPGLTFTTIDASSSVTCGTPAAGATVCWGLNLMGKLGIGTRLEMSTEPLPVAGGHRFTAISGGQTHICALTAEGAAYCWGAGIQGELGAGPRLP